MRKISIYPIYAPIFAIVPLIAACAGSDERNEYRGSALEALPFVHKTTVQQGNIVTEELVDRLQPGMTRDQVRFLLGTPMLVDLFHTDRWDYTYTIGRGYRPSEVTRLTLFFSGDALTRIEGDLRPDSERAAEREPSERVVSVPDWEDKRGLLSRAFTKVGLERAE